MDSKTCPRCGASEASRSYNYGWFVTYSCGSTHFFEKDGREISGGGIPKQSRLCMEAELRLSRSEVESLRKRVAALEDAERIAWALAHVGFDIPCYITWSRAASEWRLTTPFTDADRAAGLMGNVRYHWLGSGKAPRLTPDARAAIDAARKENNGG